jgi:hypothetical protein
LIHLAVVSGQSFLELLQWHPRDVDTLEQLYQDEGSRRRMQAAREEARRWQ